MKAKERYSWISAAILGVLILTSSSNGFGQTQINLATQGRNVDFTNAPFTKPVRSGTTLPAQCSANELFLNSTAAPGQNLYVCLNGSWTALAAQNGLSDPGSNGLVKRTGVNASAVVAAPLGMVVGTTDVQTLTGKSIDASELNSGVLTSARMPALTGDVISTSGSTATALANVLGTPGTFGDATHSVQVTVDGKGRVTSLSTYPITTGPSTVYNQQISNAGSVVAQRSSLNFSSAFQVTDNGGASRTELNLAAVNAVPGTYGASGQIPVLTVNAYGQITSISTAATASTNSGGSNTSSTTTMNSGTLSTLPASCSVGNLYFATDQPSGQQIYTCSSSNGWSQLMSLGGSGALAFNSGSLDIVTSVIPRLAAANTFTGSNTFAGTNTFSSGLTLASATAQPSCSNASRGLFWFQNNGASKDGLQVCAYNGSAYLWVSLY